MSLFSVNTNLGALAALQSLESTQQALNTAQNEVSTGQKVSSAADNPAVYSIANTINANIAGLSAVSDSLNFGAQVVATASSAVTSVSSVLQSLQQTVTSANTSGENLQTLQNQVSSALTEINQYATDATFSGVNLLASKANVGDVTSNSLNVVQSVDGGVYSVSNLINASSATNNNSLTDTLGISSLSVTGGTGGTIGANFGLTNASTIATAFDPGATTAGTDAALQLTLGNNSAGNPQTVTFEFVDDSANNGAGTSLQSVPSATNTVVAVHFDSTKDSTNNVVADLQNALTSNGFAAVLQSDGSLNIAGNGLTALNYGTVATGTFTSSAATTTSGTTNTDATSGVAVTALTANSTNVTLVQGAVQTLNSISAKLGAASDQITGIQNFTTSLSSALTAGVGALTDADLASESARLTSLQTKQQLATQSLTIANQQPQSLLTLFKNA